MAKKKRARIAALKAFPNVTHHPSDYKGQWRTVFNNDNPMTLELGCGKGDYALTLAQQNPNRNYIGVDLKGSRLWTAANQAMEKNIRNVFFIRGNVLDLTNAFEPGDISEIWITFPDPYRKKPRKRLTASRYLDVYKQICLSRTRIHLKTDDDELYRFSLESISDYGCTIHHNIKDVHGGIVDEKLKIMTFYEKQHIAAGLSIKYIQFSLPQEEES